MPKAKRHSLFPIGYDEVSLVDEGAGEEVDVLIMKRNNSIGKARQRPTTSSSGQSGGGIGTATRKGPRKKKSGGRSLSNPCVTSSNSTGAKTGNSSQRAKNWKEGKHPRDEKGQYDQSSSESKAENGKGGTTKAKLDAACRNSDRKKQRGGSGGQSGAKNMKPPGKKIRDITSDPEEQARIRRRRRKQRQKGAVQKSALSTWSSNNAHVRAIMERKSQ